jgi:hypothetical protein
VVTFFDFCVILFGYMPGSLFNPEIGHTAFFRNVGKLLQTTRRHIPKGIRPNHYNHRRDNFKQAIS